MHATPRTTFAQGAQAGTLPSVSWVYGPGGQDFHPGPRTKMSDSDAWLGQAVASLASGPDWPHVVAFSHVRRLGRMVRPRCAAAGRDVPQQHGPVPLWFPRSVCRHWPLREGEVRLSCDSRRMRAWWRLSNGYGAYRPRRTPMPPGEPPRQTSTGWRIASTSPRAPLRHRSRPVFRTALRG